MKSTHYQISFPQKLFIVLVTSMMFMHASYSQFSGSGSGTEMDPYIITTPTHLDEVRNDLTAHYELANIINLSAGTLSPLGDFYNGGAGWEPIGEVSSTGAFSGSFNGGSWPIIGLNINRPTEDNVGLFAAVTSGAEISNVVLHSFSVTGRNNVGALVGNRFVFLGGNGYTISNISLIGSVTGEGQVGGLLGVAGDANGSITTTISQIATSGSSSVTGTSNVGGLIGSASSIILQNSYSLNRVNGPGAGLIGTMGTTLGNETNSIINCYAAGFVDGDAVDGIAGGTDVENTVTNSYFNVETSTVLNSTLGTRLSDDMMKQEAFFQEWDFTSVWAIDEGNSYPYLQSFVPDPLPSLNPITSALQFAGGIGTEAFPWEITTAEHLNSVRDFADEYFILKNDLNLSTATGVNGGDFYNGGLGWDPIDNFQGNFDGGGFTISGLTINRGDESAVGLFGALIEAEVSNLLLVNVDVSGLGSVGGLAGSATNSYINSVGVRGTITGETGSVGGVVGSMTSSDMDQSYSTGTVTATATDSENVGGLTGFLVLDGDLDIGIQNSYSTANITGGDVVGGITGSTNASKITNCYFSGETSADGSNFSALYGGLLNFTAITNSYWNSEVTCILNGNRAADLLLQSTFQSWDFSTIWGIDEGSAAPHLLWQGMSEDHNFPLFSFYQLPLVSDVEANCQIELPNPVPSIISSCGNETFGTPDVTFPITQVGTTVVTWTFINEFGDVITEPQNFIVNPDLDAPIPQLADLPDLTDECSITVVDAPLADDECQGVITGVADVTFPITTQGTTVVTWTYEDGEGNASFQMQNIIIEDVTAPVPDLDMLPTIPETCVVNAVTPPTATDNCDNQIMGTTDTTFPVTAQGETTITWTYTDEAGNITTQDQILLISDEIAPAPNAATLEPITTSCDGIIQSATAPTATDNCSGQVTATTNQVFPFTPTEGSQILWQYDDGNGNTAIQFQDIIIVGKDAVTVEESLCAEQDFMFPDGTLWTGEASQVSTLTNQQGCDSLITTNITVLPEPDVALLGADEVFGCVGEELTFSIDESSVDFTTYTISTLFGNSSTDSPLTFEFSNALAAATTTGDVFVTIELTSANGCIGTDQVQLFDNTIINWGIGAIQNNDPTITISGSILPETGDSFSWDFGDGTTNTTDLNPTHTYEDNGTYTVTLTVTNECGSESLSSSVTIAGIETPLGLDNAELHIYPVPTTRFVKIDNAEPITVRIYSLDGKQALETIKRPNTVLDLVDLQSGQYLMKLFTENRLITTKKLVKIN